MMRFFYFAIALLCIACSSVSNTDIICDSRAFPLRGISLFQRGILEFNGREILIEVRSKKNEAGNFLVEMSSDSFFLVRAEIDSKGNIISIRDSCLMPENIFKKFALRDFKSSIGIIPHGRISLDENGLARKIEAENYNVKFSDFRKFENILLPYSIYFCDDYHSLNLVIVKIFK